MSTQTEHIGLHQWESTDPFLREDFNEDNRKIDEAVGVIPVFSIAQKDITAEDTSVEFDLSQLNLEGISQLILLGRGTGGTTSLLVNKDSERGKYSFYRYWGNNDYNALPTQINFMLFNFNNEETGGCGRAYFYPTGGNSVGVEVVSIGPYIERMYGHYKGCTFSQMKTLTVQFSAGITGQLLLYGVKA